MVRRRNLVQENRRMQQTILRSMANDVQARLPEGWGFALFAFPMDTPPKGEEVRIHYISSGDRASVAENIGIWLRKQLH